MRSTLATLAGSAQPNEDFAAVTDDLAVVLDGATTPGVLETGCSHGTRWYSRALGTEIISRLTLDPAPSLTDGLAEAIASLAKRHANTCDIGHPGHPSATVALLRETEQAFEYLVLSDATIVFDAAHGITAFTDPRLDHVANEQRQALRRAIHGTAHHQKALANLTAELRTHRNRPGGFWVAAVDPQAAHEALSGALPHSEIHGAALMSDGASILADRFHTMSWPDLLALTAREGPHALLHEIRRIEHSDAAGTRWPRGKVHDDATIIYCAPDFDPRPQTGGTPCQAMNSSLSSPRQSSHMKHAS